MGSNGSAASGTSLSGVDPLRLAAAFVVGTIAVARATRLVVHDQYPPAKWVRDWWIRVTHDGAWAVLAECPFCASPYIAAVTLAVAVAGGVWRPELDTLAGWWWVLAVWAAVSYLAAMIVLRDEPPEE